MQTESLNIIEKTIKESQQKYEKNKRRIRTGCTLLDLVIGGGEGLGWPPGKIVNIVGDKSSGKTFLATEIVACNYHTHKKKFKHNYDDGESGFTFDTQKLYGMDMLNENTLQSRTIEDFDVHANKFLRTVKEGELGIYVLDSLDGVSNDEIEERSEKRYKAAEAGKKFTDGTYGMKTPKFLSQEFFRTKTAQFSEKDTLLIFISQVRENIDPLSFKKWARSGGKSLDFYAHTCLWLATITKIIKKGRAVGVAIKVKADKSKTARPFRECVFSIYFDYGIDNIGSNIDYLFDLRTEKEWKLKENAEKIYWEGKEINLDNIKVFLEAQGKLEAARKIKKKDTGKPNLSKDWALDWIMDHESLKAKFDEEFGTPCTRDELITQIESDPVMEQELEQRVIEKWERFEAEIGTQRKRKYL